MKRELDLAGGTQLTDEGMRQLAAGSMWRMSRLNLTWCVNLKDGSLEAISKGMPRLCWLSLHGIKWVSDAGLVQLSKGCRYVHALDLNACSGIQDRSEERMRKLWAGFTTLIGL